CSPFNNKTVKNMSLSKPFKQQGFTLVELLIVLVIAGILVSIAAPSFNSVVSERKLEEVRYSMASLLAYAKNEAVLRSEQVDLCGGVAAAACDGTAWSVGWRVVVNSDDDLLRVDDADTTGVAIAYDCGAPVSFDGL